MVTIIFPEWIVLVAAAAIFIKAAVDGWQAFEQRRLRRTLEKHGNPKP